LDDLIFRQRPHDPPAESDWDWFCFSQCAPLSLSFNDAKNTRCNCEKQVKKVEWVWLHLQVEKIVILEESFF